MADAAQRGGRSDARFRRLEGLLLADREGAPRAYDLFLADLRDWLTGYFGRRIRDGGVEDAVQETLIAILQSRHTYRFDGPLAPWIVAIAHRKWVDTVRRRVRENCCPLEDDLATPDHEREVLSAIVLERTLARLRPAQRDAITATRLRGASIRDVADATGQSISLVKVNIHRGLKSVASGMR